MTVRNAHRKNLLFGGILVTGVLNILGSFLDWGAHCNVVSNLPLLFLPLIIFGAFVVWLIATIIHIAMNIKRDRKFSILLLIATLAIVLTILFVPLHFWGYQYRFQSHNSEYETVVNLVGAVALISRNPQVSP